ncbi:MAG: hypothetical protein AAFO17_12235 [Pseudomonadota bacterium]
MTAIDLLCEIIAQGTKVAAAHYAQRSGFALLLDQGLLKPAGTVQSITCLNCETMHDAEIVFNEGEEGFYCPALGFVPVTPEDIAAVQPDLQLIVCRIADAIESRARKSTPIAGETWRIGRVNTEAGDIAIYLHPSIRSGQDAKRLTAALINEAGARFRLVLSAQITLAVPGCQTVPLSEAMELNTSGPLFRSECDLCDLVGAPRKKTGGAPNLYGDLLTILIKDRTAKEIAMKGRNAEARAVLSDFKQKNPHLKPPSLSSVQDYVSKFRAGQ